MTGNVHWTQRAERDIEQIADYVTTQSGRQSAGQDFFDRLEECLKNLADQPLMGPARDDLAVGLRYQPFERYLILYRVMDDGVEIDRLIHAARNIEAIFH